MLSWSELTELLAIVKIIGQEHIYAYKQQMYYYYSIIILEVIL